MKKISLTSLDVSESSKLQDVKADGQIVNLEEDDIEHVSVNSASNIEIFLGVTSENEGKLINLSKYGKFESSRVHELSKGSITDKGILFEDGIIPKSITYKYDISNDYKLRDEQATYMDVTIQFVQNQNEDTPSSNEAPSNDDGKEDDPSSDTPGSDDSPSDDTPSNNSPDKLHKDDTPSNGNDNTSSPSANDVSDPKLKVN
ncbi:MAG: hypothetical protein K6G84_04835 [Lachnospiraceae bacterium]|nr:hypothetical protein [Lachnospiraceae bacterium]